MQLQVCAVFTFTTVGGGRVVQRCWVNFQCRGVLLIWITVGQGPIVLAVDAGGGCLDIFSLIYHFSFLSPLLWETARYRLKYFLKGPLSPKQPTNQSQQSLVSLPVKVKTVQLQRLSFRVRSHRRLQGSRKEGIFGNFLFC